MNETAAGGAVPEWDTADRMRKGLREAGIGVQEMADYLEVSRNTVGTWINGRNRPSRQTLRLWAMRCGVSYEWLAGDRTRERVLGTTAALTSSGFDQFVQIISAPICTPVPRVASVTRIHPELAA